MLSHMKFLLQSRNAPFRRMAFNKILNCPLNLYYPPAQDHRPGSQSLVLWLGGGGGEGEGAEPFTCPYPLRVQARPPQDQRLAT